MFNKVLIANRGEIACRVIRTCQRLGIATVAVYSDADADAMHALHADEKVRLGPPPAAESYLQIERIVEACKLTGAEAVHPGYGFLSERAAFAEALDEAGVVFIGPPANAIRAMGDKIESKRLAKAAGVSTVPGTNEAVSDPALALEIAREIGYPVMVKASAGGGGKGMRVAHDDAGLVEGLERARSEARSSFGDDRCFIEKYVQEPRHIEIQVLGDKHGNVLHLGERECSIQRRHQKVIEEAPSPFLDAATREAMGSQAVALAQAVGYFSAGTVEFIVDKDKNFYFLEMNTRLQVEHPVTELVTGFDLVEQMLRVAAGERLSFGQDDVRMSGHAIEARVYAEEPGKGFLPSIGRLVTCVEPAGEGVRVDTGVTAGGEVSMFYDPMIAKLCAHAPTRPRAIERLRAAIDAYVIRGPGHNLAFLGALLGHPRFIEGRLTTNFIAEEYGERFEGVELPPERLRRVVAVALAMRAKTMARDARISGRLVGAPPPDSIRLAAEVNGTEFVAEVGPDADGTWGVAIDGSPAMRIALDWRPGLPLVRAKVDVEAMALQALPLPEGYELTHAGVVVRVTVRDLRAQELARLMPAKTAADTSKLLLSPMPGLILSLPVGPGDEIKAGQELCVLEAMKMENVLRAERDATVETVEVAVRDTVGAEQVLMTFG